MPLPNCNFNIYLCLHLKKKNNKNKLPKKEERKQLVYLRLPLFSFAVALLRDDDVFTLGLGLNGKSQNALNTTQ